MYSEPIYLKAEIVNKRWGHEQIICNNEEFCGKRLIFNKGAKFASHFHYFKREVFYLIRGQVKLITINTENADKIEKILNIGDIVEIPRLLPHQIIALEDSEIIEFSTHHEDSDSYRVEKGDSQLKND